MRDRECVKCRFYDKAIHDHPCDNCYGIGNKPEFKPYKSCAHHLNKELDCVHTDSTNVKEPCSVCNYANGFPNYNSTKDVKVVIVDSDPKAVDVVRKLLNNDAYAKCAAIILEADTASGVITPPELPKDLHIKTSYEDMTDYALRQAAKRLRSVARDIGGISGATGTDRQEIRRIAERLARRARAMKKKRNKKNA